MLRGRQARQEAAAAASAPLFDPQKGMPQMCIALVAMFTYFFWLLALYQVDVKFPLQRSLLSAEGLDQDAILKIATTEALWAWLLDFLHRQVPSAQRLQTRHSRFVPTAVRISFQLPLTTDL